MKDSLESLPTHISIGTHGYVSLIDVMPRLVDDVMGADAAVVQAARASYGKGTKIPTLADINLLRYLFRHSHMTPFEMIVLKFGIKAPIFTARQWMRHRAGSFNEQSARYSKIPMEFYLPEQVMVQDISNKQKSGEAASDEQKLSFLDITSAAYETAAAAYEENLREGVSRELSRIVLPEGRYTTFYWTVNLRNLFHFLELRMSEAAQDNIQEYSKAIFEILKLYCPYSTKAFEDYSLNMLKLTALEVRALTSNATEEMSEREKAEWKDKSKKFTPISIILY